MYVVAPGGTHVRLMFVTADVLSEEVILKWYKEGHSVKGKMMFLDQMKKFIEWLQNAEEGKLKNMNTSSVMHAVDCSVMFYSKLSNLTVK
jgi:hypothetical protein